MSYKVGLSKNNELCDTSKKDLSATALLITVAILWNNLTKRIEASTFKYDVQNCLLGCTAV
jgi:hypothetical protein